MHQCPALQLFGAGREKRLYAIPPYTDVESLDFEDYPFTVQSWDEACAICGSTDTYLDEVILDDQGNRMFVCSDTDCCARRAAVRDGRGARNERLERRPHPVGPEPDPPLRGAHRLPWRLLRPLARRSAWHRGRIRVGQKHAPEHAFGTHGTDLRDDRLPRRRRA